MCLWRGALLLSDRSVPSTQRSGQEMLKVPAGPKSGLEPILGLNFLIYIVQMALDRVVADAQVISNFLV